MWVRALSPFDQLNTHGSRTLTDQKANPAATYMYRVEALNKVGYGGDYPSMTAQSVSDPAGYGTATVAGPPRIGTPVAGNGRATVNWPPPLLGGQGHAHHRLQGADVRGYRRHPDQDHQPSGT